MWQLLFVPFLLVLHDYMKAPIDNLYFTNPKRPLVGIRNALIDFINWTHEYSVNNHPGLWLVKAHYENIREEFQEVSWWLRNTSSTKLTWFDKNDNTTLLKTFQIKSLINQIPSSTKRLPIRRCRWSDGIPPHGNKLVTRIHLTIEGGGDCTLYTEKGRHRHCEGEDFLFDHARYHEVTKTDLGRRVVLILDVHRCF